MVSWNLLRKFEARDRPDQFWLKIEIGELRIGYDGKLQGLIFDKEFTNIR